MTKEKKHDQALTQQKYKTLKKITLKKNVPKKH